MKCVACGNERDFKKLSPELCSADNWLCQKCGLVFIPRGSDEKHDYYRGGGYYTRSPNLAARRALTSRHLLLGLARKRVERVEQLLHKRLVKMSVLDVGCGYGEILGFLKLSRECDVLGLEPSAATARAGGEMFGVQIVPALFEDHPFDGAKFDLVVCNHTLEHVADPARFLGMLQSPLKPTGLLYLEVPNVMWPSGGFALEDFLYHEHLQTFTSWNLALLLKRCGWQVDAYSDEDFLRFVCRPGDRATGVQVPALSATAVENFLRRYKDNYSVGSHARVYAGKLDYLLKLSYSKLLDLIA